MAQKDRREEIVKDYYNNYKEDERFVAPHRRVEYITTMNYIEKFLKKGNKVLELGAGTGAYSIALAKKGYHVDAVELSEHNLDLLQINGADIENLTIRQGDAVELGMYVDELFDVTLSLGPMFHIFNEKDMKNAIKEAVRVTKKGGIIIFSYLTNDSVFARYMVQKGNMKKYKSLCDSQFNFKPLQEEIFYTTNVKDFEDMVNKEDVTKVLSVSADGISEILATDIDKMSEEDFNIYLAYHLARCEREELFGYSSHMLYICRKN